MTADLGHHYIAGAWRSDAPHGSHPVENPSDRSVIGTAPDGSAELASEAVMAGRGSGLSAHPARGHVSQ